MNIFLLTVILAVELAQLPKPIQQKINNLYGTYFKADFKQVVDSLTPDEKVTIIRYLKEDVIRADNENSSSASEDVLVGLGDDEAISREVEKFKANVFQRQSLFGSVQPKVIAATANSLYLNEPFSMGGGDDVSVPLSFETAYGMAELMKRSPYFSKEVNDWAASWVKLGFTPDIRGSIRKWWSANQQYFRSGNYAAVQPGDPPPGAAPASPTATPLPIPTPFPRVAEFTPSSAPSSSMVVIPENGSSAWVYLVAVIAVGGLAGVGVWYFWKKS